MPSSRPLLPADAFHLADRFSYGVTPALATDVRLAGSGRAWMRQQLGGLVAEDPRALLVDTWFPLLQNPPQLTAALADQGVRTGGQVATELIARNFARRILSRRQVFETMVDFWSNLLYIPAYHGRAFPWRRDFEDRVIRGHALGRYVDMLQAAVQHPAMNGFLDNDLNHRGALNENLGRELLELHSVGSRYRERDVVDSARLLTGFTIAAGTTFDAGYSPARHSTGRVRVLGFSHPNHDHDGRPALRAYLRYLALHPATARRIAQRLCVRFVSDDPPRGVVDAVAATYRRSGSDIAACLTTLSQHPAFQRSRGSKIRTPSDDVVHTARVMGLSPVGALPDGFLFHLVDLAQQMGQVSLRWQAPDGWPEQTRGYLSASRVLKSWQVHLDLAGTNGFPLGDVLVAPRLTQLPLTSFPMTLAQLVDEQSLRLVGHRADRALVHAVARATGISRRHTLLTPLDLNETQYRLLRGIVRNSPRGLER